MRSLLEIIPQNNYKLDCTFDDGVKKTVDLTSLLSLPVFQVLKEKKIFNSLINKKYFIEWTEYEIDLSADTLYNL